MKDTLRTISKEQLENRAREKSNMLSNEQTQMYAQKAKKKIILFSIIIAAFCIYAIVFSILFMQKIFVSIVYLLGLFADTFVSFKLLHKSDKELAIFSLKSEIKKSYHLEYISQELPSVAKTISVNANNCSTILIDETKQKLIFQKGRKISEAISFSAITGYDVYENGESKVSGTAGKALVGGVFFGLGGMIVGSSMGRKISNQCKQLKLIVHISNLNCPQMVLSFVDKKCEKSSSAYRKKIENLQYVRSTLEYIINRKTLEESATQSQAKDISVEKTSNKEKLQELKEMLDDGLITQEDYEQKKKQIIGL